MHKFQKTAILSLIALFTSVSSFCFAQDLITAPAQIIRQWVKITTANFYDFTYKTHVESLESTTTSCGNDCSIIKLSTTPFTDGGILHLQIDQSISCGSSGKVDIPFTLENGYLITPKIKYLIPIEGNYCIFTSVDALVSGSAENGFEINLIGH